MVTASIMLAVLGFCSGAPSEAQAADSALSVTHGTIRATTLAGNLNGTEAVLKGNSSASTQTISGKGPLVLMARGTSCKGKAKVRVYVNNKKVKDISLSAAKKFTKYTVKSYSTDASRTVKVRLINNKGTKKCNRDAFVAGSYMSGAATSTSASTTPSTGYGVPAGTDLKVVNGDITVTKDGTVIDGIDLRGYVIVKADNVTIQNSVIRGGAAATSTKALIMAWWQPKNLRILHSTLAATNHS
ncbi:MAG TPA: carbohydrate-binding domain-containing protein, partial [Propionicimonas sp.]|uniref:carbohydrate-binding domain-containing protein n=1 Tax=Propionicimonas sp. TaxID=1955623 RepID=UPI002F419A5F